MGLQLNCPRPWQWCEGQRHVNSRRQWADWPECTLLSFKPSLQPCSHKPQSCTGKQYAYFASLTFCQAEGMVKLQTGGSKKKKKSSAWTQWNAALLDKDKSLRSFWGFFSVRKRDSNFAVKLISKTWCIGLWQKKKIILKSLTRHLFGPFSNYIWRCLNVIKICAGWTAWAQITAPKWLEKHASLASILITTFSNTHNALPIVSHGAQLYLSKHLRSAGVKTGFVRGGGKADKGLVSL